MKTDAALKQDVEAELDMDPAVPSTSIGVLVTEGVVTLVGHVATFAEKTAAKDAVLRVSGVKALALEMDVQLSPEHRRSDTEVAVAARQALLSNTTVPADRIRVTVEKGRVALQGEVEWDFQRRNAEAAVRSLYGVISISNGLTLALRETSSAIQHRIADALKRHIDREVERIDIQVDGATVTLRGSIDTLRAREAAEGTVWGIPGVLRVVNELKVG